MSIKKSEAILKYFIALKCSVWFTLGSEDETMFCDTTFFSLSAGQGFQNTKMTGSPMFPVNFTKSKNPS